jgi:tyrosyl-tRNA synthetase
VDREDRIARIARGTVELLTPEDLRALLARTDRPRAYIGFEPSGRLTVGHLVCARKMRDLVEAGCDLTLFLADWHAWINDKLGGSMERIQAAGRYMAEAFAALGVGPEHVTVRWAHDLLPQLPYWSRVIRIAKGLSLARTKRAMTLLGRGEEEEKLDTAKLFYPSMQAADIFELPVEIAYAGIDQRRAHILARETAQANGWPVPVAVHTPLISALTGGGRMDVDSGRADRKMSKSDPRSSIQLPSSPKLIEERVRGAYCPAREVDGNPIVEIARWIGFGAEDTLTVERSAQHGGTVTYESEGKFLAAWRSGELHPGDLKPAVADLLAREIAPVERYFAAHPESLRALDEPTPSAGFGAKGPS